MLRQIEWRCVASEVGIERPAAPCGVKEPQSTIKP